MLVHITEAVIITGKKDGRRWLKLSFVKPDGATGVAMLEDDGKPLPVVDITQEELLKFTQTDVVFDDRGRVVSVQSPLPQKQK